MRAAKIFLILPNNAPDNADDFRVGSVDGGVIFVLGHEPDLAIFPQETLDSGLILDPGDHDLTVVRALLGADNHLVPGQNSGV